MCGWDLYLSDGFVHDHEREDRKTIWSFSTDYCGAIVRTWSVNSVDGWLSSFESGFVNVEIVVEQQVEKKYDTFGGDIKRYNSETNRTSSELLSLHECCFKSLGQMQLSHQGRHPINLKRHPVNLKRYAVDSRRI